MENTVSFMGDEQRGAYIAIVPLKGLDWAELLIIFFFFKWWISLST